MVRSRDGEDLAGDDMVGDDLAGANTAGARYQQARAASVRHTDGISGSGVLRVWNHWSVQHILYVHLGVPPTVKIVVSYWCAHKTGASVCDAHHCEAWYGSRQDFPVPDGILR